MKKSAIINLVLIATVAAACGQKKEDEWEGSTKKKVYMRSDTTASYSRAHYRGSLLPFFVFRAYGAMGANGYRRTGFYSDASHSSSNAGQNSAKSSISRSGFGRSGFHASS